jgi:hypothetical protein
MAEDNITSAVHALDVSSPIQCSAAVIVLGLLCIARPASSIVIAMNHYIFLRYFYYDPTTMILSQTEPPLHRNGRLVSFKGLHSNVWGYVFNWVTNVGYHAPSELWVTKISSFFMSMAFMCSISTSVVVMVLWQLIDSF